MTETTLYQVEDGWIETYKGHKFHFADPQPSEFDIEDIAHALSMLCRYNGHTQRFYSVAEHSCLIAEWLLNHGYGRQVAYTGLMHDIAEAYIGDMPRPVKQKVPEFKMIEGVIERAASRRFGFMYPFPPIIKSLDTRILVDERQQIMSDSLNEWGADGLDPLNVLVEGWSPLVACESFLLMYESLTDDE